MRKCILYLLFLSVLPNLIRANSYSDSSRAFAIRGFHLDLRIQVMTMPALRAFATRLHDEGINTALSLHTLATYPAIFKQNVTVTAGNSCSISDGAASI
ncbi:MAG: hypothetical protein ACHQEM_10910, partial [Chitinophagales bacterium]